MPDGVSTVGFGPIGIGDLDSDGHLDVVLDTSSGSSAGGSYIEYYLGLGDGTFEPVRRIVPAETIFAMVVGDLDGDAAPDLAIAAARYADIDEDGVYVLFGNGASHFCSIGHDIIGTALDIEIVDINNDGNNDLIAGNQGKVFGSVFLGNGAGSFAPELAFRAPYGGGALVIRDVNRDGQLDVAMASWGGDLLTVIEGNGDGTFGSIRATGLSVGSNPGAIGTHDLDGDGHLDVATANRDSNDITVRFGLGRGEFSELTDVDAGTKPWRLIEGDLDDDGDADLISVNLGSQDASVILNLGDRTFAPELRILIAESPAAVSLGRLDHDAFPDLIYVTPTDSIQVMVGQGDGTFVVGGAFLAGTAPNATAIADLNLDGKNDLIVGNRLSEDISVLLGNGDGTFAPEFRFTLFAVGTPVTGRPPHRSQRALLTHWAPASGPDVKPLFRVGVVDPGSGYPALGKSLHPSPGQLRSLAPAP